MTPLVYVAIARTFASGVISFLATWWRELVIAVLVFYVLGLKDTIREKEVALADLIAQHELAAAASQARGATTGQEAVENYVQQTQQDAPVVERVVERVRNVCVRPTADRDLPVPGRAEAPDGAAAPAGDDGDRAFAEAIGRDLAACNDELNKLGRLQDWVRANGG